MILVDFSKVAISGIIKQVDNSGQIDIRLSRHFILNSLRAINSKHRGTYGQMVICMDDRKYWRRDIFPYYKARRRLNKAEGKGPKIDWQQIYTAMDTIKGELKEFFSYPCIQIDNAEADDIIGTLAYKAMETGEQTLIVASDKDYHQLTDALNIRIFCNTKKKFVEVPNPVYGLFEKIMTGDGGDDVPNVRSDDDVFVNPDKRQAPVSKKFIKEAWDLHQKGEWPTAEHSRNWYRNTALIDLSKVPVNIKDATLKSLEEQQDKPKKDIMNYLISHQLRNLIESIGDF